MENVDLFSLIDELQEEIEASPSRGLSKTKSIDTKIVMEIIDDIRKAAQDELDYSSRLVQEREQILAEANAQAEEILNKARSDAKTMVTENAVTRAAYDKATKLLDTSREKAHAVRSNADVYASEVLEELENYFAEYIDIIRENRRRLTEKKAAAEAAAQN